MSQKPACLAAFAAVCSAVLIFSAPFEAYAAAGDNRKLNKEANELFLEEKYTEALAAYEEILSEEPEGEENFQARYGKAMCLVRTEHYYQALEQLQDMDGAGEEEMIRISDAKRQIKEAILKNPNEDVIFHYRNRMMGMSSFAAMKVILSAYPDYPGSEYYRAFFYMDVFNFDTLNRIHVDVLGEICRYFEIMMNSYPWQNEFKTFYESVMALQIDRYFENGELEEAERVTDRTLRRNPDSAKFLSCKGALLNCKGEYEEAETYLRQAAEQDPTLRSVYENLMESCYHQKKYEETAEAANMLLAMDGDNVYAYAYLGRSCKKMGEKELGAQYIQKVSDAVSDYNKVCALAICGRKKAAVQLLAELSVQNGEYLTYAKQDDDLQNLHIRSDFRTLVGESYREEFSDFYLSFFAAVAALLCMIQICMDIRKKRRVEILLPLLFGALATSLLMPRRVYARDFDLNKTETEEIYGGNLIDSEQEAESGISGQPGISYEDEVCREEIAWFTDEIAQGLRTVLPLDAVDTEEAGELVRAATVNVQAIFAGSIYGQGTGVIASYTDEEIIVIGCRHTLYTERMRVRFTDETYAPAEIIGKSEDYDFMVLRVKTEDVPEKTLSYIKKINIDYEAAKELSVSDDVLSNGYITTRGYMCFDGKVTNLRKKFYNFEPYYTNKVEYLLTDTEAEAGTSGGGTFDGYGNFVGLQAGIVVATKERYVVPLDTIAQEYMQITGEMLE